MNCILKHEFYKLKNHACSSTLVLTTKLQKSVITYGNSKFTMDDINLIEKYFHAGVFIEKLMSRIYLIYFVLKIFKSDVL